MQSDWTPFYHHFYQLISRLEFELTGDIVLHELLSLVFAVIGRPLNVYTVPKVLFYKQYRTLFLFLIPERGETSGINECPLLGKIVTEVG